MKPLILINCVGLSPHHISPDTPHLQAIAARNGARPMRGVVPAVTLPAQATMLTGLSPTDHGIVGNGWLYRDTSEIRFWQQSRKLVNGQMLYDTARARATAQGEPFTCAKMFWWFNQGAQVEYSVTPKPWYGCDGNKVFGIHGTPDDLCANLQNELGPFPFHTFWGPMAGLPCSVWIARATATLLTQKQPTLTLVYLPHLDYDLQRFGGTGPHLQQALQELDRCVGHVRTAAQACGAEIVVVSEYGITNASTPVHLNRVLRNAGFLRVRNGPFGETIDTHNSHAFAVADHQLAHIYLNKESVRSAVRELLQSTDGVGTVWSLEEKQAHGLAHPRAGALIALADPAAWFTYYYWLDDAHAPDFAPTIDIHRKPGYDPAELFFDTDRFRYPKLAAGWRLLKKKLGLRTRFDMIPTTGARVRGSHGLAASDPQAGPVLLSTAHAPCSDFAMTDLKEYCLAAMDLPK